MNVAQGISVDPTIEKYLSTARKLLIDGKWTEAQSGKTFPVYDPSTGAVMANVAEADAADVDKAVKAASLTRPCRSAATSSRVGAAKWASSS